MKRTTFLLLAVCAVAFLSLVLRPVPTDADAPHRSVRGTVEMITATDAKDVYFFLEDSDRRFYINRGTERGLHLDSLQATLIGKEVTITYPKYWTPFDATGRTRSIWRIETANEVIFDQHAE